MSDHGYLVAQITPLLWDQAAIDPATVLTATQFGDVTITHPLNNGVTASLSLSMYDPIVTNLKPYQQALRITYFRPGATLGEVVFWGQCNIEEDYSAAKLTLQAQDPSLRLQHHYIRTNDAALNDPKDHRKGSVSIDFAGIEILVAAGQVGLGADLGLLPVETSGYVGHPTKRLSVERGQELWSLIQDVVTNEIGPDIDLRPAQNLSDGYFAWMDLYESLQADRTATVQFAYGYPQDNLTNITVAPDHPTTEAHIIDTRPHWLASAVAPDQRAETGIFMDFISTDHDAIGTSETNVMLEVVSAHVRAYARPPAQTELTLRKDPEQDHYFGHPLFGARFGGDTVGDFYIGDLIHLDAVRGNRSFAGACRIMGVELAQQGPRGQVETKVSVVPRPGPVNILTSSMNRRGLR